MTGNVIFALMMKMPHTSIVSVQGVITVRFWTTDIIRWNDNAISLNSGGYRTATTKKRMNAISNAFELGYHVYQDQGVWCVEFKGRVTAFKDNMTIDRCEPPIGDT